MKATSKNEDQQSKEKEIEALKNELEASKNELLRLSKLIAGYTKNEDYLKEEREKFRLFFENAPIGKAMTRTDGVLIIVNKAFSDMLGYTVDELKSINFTSITHPDDVQKSQEKIKSVLSGKNSHFTLEKRYLHKDGKIIWTEVSTSIQKDPSGKPTHFITHIQDITSRKNTEIKLKESEERYFLASVASDNGIWDWQILSNDLYYSPQWKAQIGYQPDELKNEFKTWENHLHPDEYDSKVKAVNDFLANPTDFFFLEFRFRHKDGSYRWIYNKSAAVLDESGKVIRMFGAHTDITERKSAEIKLKESEERYFLASAASDNGIWDWQILSNDLYYSPQWKAQIGYQPDELKNEFKTWEDHLHPDEYDSKVKAINGFLTNPTDFFTLEFRFRHKDGSYRWIYNKSAAVLDENGKVIRMFGAHTDITERKKLEIDLKNALIAEKNANQYKNNFLSNMSHEIRTPMNGIIGFANLLRDDSLLKEDRDKYLDIIDQSGNQLLSLIDDIIDVSKIEAGELKIIKGNIILNEELNNIKTLFEHLALRNGKDSVQISLNLPEVCVSIIQTDLHRFKQVFINLLGNALKFSQKGIIEFGYRYRSKIIDNKKGNVSGDEITIDTNKLNKSDQQSIELEFYVKDEGIGIPIAKLDKIFDRYQQSSDDTTIKYGGAGLGLTISKKIVGLLGGEIWVESVENQGSTFYFTHPLEVSENNSKQDKPSHSLVAKFKDLSKAKNLLLAEDDLVNQNFIMKVFKDCGVNIEIASNGKEAVSLYKKNPNYDLVLMDIRMPEMNGFIASEKILEMNPKAVIIAQTAYAFNEERDKCLETGIADVITKPINPDEIRSLVYKYLKQSEG